MTKSLIKKALKVILITEKASAANFQRLLGIGYAQAAHLLDELQELVERGIKIEVYFGGEDKRMPEATIGCGWVIASEKRACIGERSIAEVGDTYKGRRLFEFVVGRENETIRISARKIAMGSCNDLVFFMGDKVFFTQHKLENFCPELCICTSRLRDTA